MDYAYKIMEKTRSRSRSAHGCSGKTGSRRSGHKKSSSAGAPLHPDAAPECARRPPPPCRPAGPFALFFATNYHQVETKEVMCEVTTMNKGGSGRGQRQCVGISLLSHFYAKP